MALDVHPYGRRVTEGQNIEATVIDLGSVLDRRAVYRSERRLSQITGERHTYCFITFAVTRYVSCKIR